MSLFGALNIGVAGLAAQSNALSIASSNIANVNTVGYKTDSAQFSTLVAGNDANGSAGVTVDTQHNFSQQGLLSTTSSPTDLGISGNGLFVVSQDGSTTSPLYTRAGNFTPDATGVLQNAAGYKLLGWALDSAGNAPANPSALSTINVSNISGKAKASTTLTLQANLQASATADTTYAVGDINSGKVTPQFQRTINVFDSQGGSQPLQLSFVKTGPDTWAYEVSYQGNNANIGGATSNPIAHGTMSFNADGSLANADTSGGPTGSINVTIPWAAASGLAAQKVKVSLGTVGQTDGLSQFDAPSALASSNVDGASFGNISGVSIGKDGIVTARFSNGLTQNLYKIPLATFASPDGLSPVSGSAYQASRLSGTASLNGATSGGAGAINSGELEGSTVDLATEFTNLITTQRAYAASSRIVTTASAMLENLIQTQ